MARKIARIEQIDEVSSIEGADRIDVARVGGWRVVVRKGEFAVGDSVVFFEIDTFLPTADPRFAFLATRGEKTMTANGQDVRGHVLKTAKMRGVVSQGLVLRAADILGPDEIPTRGTEVAEHIGVIQWEPPVEAGSDDLAGPFPTYLAPKSDAERVQNLTFEYELLRTGAQWFATEKIDGTSITVARDPDGVLFVCSRNNALREGNGVHWQAVRELGLDAMVQPGQAIQAEVFGPKVQANPLKVAARSIAVFAFIENRRVVPRSDWPAAVVALGAPVYEGIELPASVDAAIAQANGIKSLISPNLLAEGIVWHTASGQTFDELDGRTCFKVISNAWLIKHEG